MATTKKLEIEGKLRELKNQLEETNKAEMYDDMAIQLHNMYNSLVNAGFTFEQAWELTKTIVNNTVRI